MFTLVAFAQYAPLHARCNIKCEKQAKSENKTRKKYIRDAGADCCTSAKNIASAEWNMASTRRSDVTTAMLI